MLYITVKAGRGDEFERTWEGIADEVRRAPGNVRQTLLRDPADPHSFVVASDWETREAFGVFEKSPEQDDLTAPLRDLRESGRMTVHEIVTHLEGGSG